MKQITPVIFFVNGKKIVEPNCDPEWTLAFYLREKLSLCGTKLGCEAGACGSCTVVIGKWNESSKKANYVCANSCLVPVFQVHGKAVTTVEGLGSVKLGLHAVQDRLSLGHGSQCGFCTPGMVMSMFALLRNKPKPTKQDIEFALRGNLCRCTGYRPIVQSFQTFGCGKENCCQTGQKKDTESISLTDWTLAKEYDPTQDPIFPPQLQIQHADYSSTLFLQGIRSTLISASSLKEFNLNVQNYSSAVFISSGIEFIRKSVSSASIPKTLLCVNGIRELNETKINGNNLLIGAGLTIQEVQNTLQEVKDFPLINGLIGMLDEYSSPQTKNTATLVGNLMSPGRFVSDIKTSLLALDTKLHVFEGGNIKVIPLEFNDQTGTPKLSDGTLVAALELPLNLDFDLDFTKQGVRHGPEQSIVNIAVRVCKDSHGSSLNTVVGGLQSGHGGPSKINITRNGMNRISEICKEFAAEVEKLCPEDTEDVKYRRLLALSMFYKIISRIIMEKETSLYSPQKSYEPMFSKLSAQEIDPEQPESDPVGRPIMTQSGKMHTTGEAQYTDDIKVAGLCHGALVQSSKAHAVIKSVDTSKALALANVLGYVDIKDIPVGGVNCPGFNPGCMIGEDDLAFADGKVTTIGQVIGAIIAKDIQTARFAAKLVVVEYEDREVISTMESANSNKSFIKPKPLHAEMGDQNNVEALERSDLQLSGEIEIGGQEHFYMENNCAVVIPEENGQITILCSTQSSQAVQMDISRLLNIPMHNINVKLRRIGGGFGGKASTHGFSLFPAVLAALKLNKPVKIALNRYEDMIITGKRHPAKTKYQVGFTKDGKLQALKVDALLDCGHATDVSPFVAEVFTTRFDHVYAIPSMSVDTTMLRTNKPSNTAFRGFGCPQAFFMMETIIEKIARHLKLPVEKVRQQNFALTDCTTLTGFKITETNDYLLQCWNKCLEVSDYYKRRLEIETFNKSSPHNKRGLAIIPTRFGVGSAGLFFEQGHALIHVYRDGSVLISHGGIEIGQGINTKCLQVASRMLNISLDKITITDHSTDKVPNATASSGSIGADIWGLGVKNACEELLLRLEPVKMKYPNKSWPELIETAYMKRIGLSVTGIGRPKFEGPPGVPRYNVCGAVCTEVEVDCLTGDHKILRTDVVIDIGHSINPAIDIGQIEGGFVQGYGFYTSEELKFDKKSARLLSDNGLSYKIPNALSIPRKFNVVLLKGSPERNNLFSSKGIGEPSLFLGASVYFSIMDAVNSCRHENGQDAVFLDSPATPAKIRLACPIKLV